MAAAPPGEVEPLTSLDELEGGAGRRHSSSSSCSSSSSTSGYRGALAAATAATGEAYVSHAQVKADMARTRSEKAAAEVDELVTNLTANIDRQLTTSDGKRTFVFWLCVVLTWAMGVTFVFGTFITDSLLTLYKTGDTVMALGCGMGISLTCIIIPLSLEDARRTVSGAPDGALRSMGVGTVMIGPDQMKKIKKVNTTFNAQWQSPKMWMVYHIPIHIPVGALLWIGYLGVHSAWHNRLSVLAGHFLFNGVLWFVVAAKIPMQTAMSIVVDKIKGISEALDKELVSFGSDLSEKEWDQQIAEPCRELVALMDSLTVHFSKSLVLEIFFRLAMASIELCLLLSPTRQEIGPRIVEGGGPSWVGDHAGWMSSAGLVCGMVISLYTITVTIMGPASVSTACDDLKEKLNAVRISDLTHEIDGRVVILERAMSNVNHGQGIGFKIGGTVIDKKMLKVVGAKVAALASTALPVLLAVTVSMKEEIAASSADECSLSVQQNEVLLQVGQMLKATNFAGDSSCNYNITLAEIFAMGDGV